MTERLLDQNLLLDAATPDAPSFPAARNSLPTFGVKVNGRTEGCRVGAAATSKNGAQCHAAFSPVD